MSFKADGEFFDPKATLECGQLFRYRSENGGYTVISADKICFLRAEGNKVIIDPSDEAYFRRYFDLDEDYGKITSALKRFPELAGAVETGKGIRILRQDFSETVFSFIVSANNNIARIKGIVERLAAAYGKEMGGYHAFPSAAELTAASIADLKALGLGYRAEYIFETSRAFPSFVLPKDADSETAHKLLCTLKGVGPKVADCIVLFGLHITRSYPVDTWIFKACSAPGLDTPKKVRDYYLDRYGDYAGFAQQYIFYASRGK